MINLDRSMNDKWIFQKNTNSKDLIKSYLNVINETKDVTDKERIIEKLKLSSGYNGRSERGSLNTMGVRFSQMCFYMFGYKNENNTFIPSQTTINLLKETNLKSKNMLINLFAIQYPHPYSNTPEDIEIHAGRLIIKLLCDEKIQCKLYIDEMIYFLPFIKKIDKKIYNELIESILEYRTLSYEQKLELFKKEYNWETLFANCVHEFSYFFARIFKSFDVLDIVGDPSHNDGKLFKFRHGDATKHTTFRNDAYDSRKKYSGYIKIKDSLKTDAYMLISKYSAFDKPLTIKDSNIFSKKDWIHDLYEVEMLNYLSIVFPEYSSQREIINAISEMQYMSKYSSVDGKDFENSLKPVMELFRENLNVEIISGAGEPDLLCVFDDSSRCKSDYKVNIEAKSRNSANNMNVMRIERHIEKYASRYCIIVAPRFSRGNDLDISGKNMVSITADILGKYCSKECLSSNDGKADFTAFNDIIENNLGKNITKNIDFLIEQKYGF